MLTFTSLGIKGNLGNQLFQISSTIGIAKKNNHNFSFPEWIYSEYFENKILKLDNNISFIKLFENEYKFHNWAIGTENYDINGALQSEKYFDIQETKKTFRFKSHFIDALTLKFNYLFEKEHIIISIRRGDFVFHPHYYQLPFEYYFLAIVKNFPDWKQRNLIFMSDDIKYCKYHFKFLSNAFFLENQTAIEQLAIASLGTDFIISNSTFSWWCAWLGEKENSKIIRPIKNFRGAFAIENDDRDYFPERWFEFNYKPEKIEMKYLSLLLKGQLGKIKDYFILLVRIIREMNSKIINKIVKSI